jgi:ectoine hydroxylase-related dioxygenase (phytanoyl-CoA dioxygenase family)
MTVAPETTTGPAPIARPASLTAPPPGASGWTLPGVFGPDELDELVGFYDDWGFAVMRGVYTEPELEALESDMELKQRALLAGELPERCGTAVLDDPDAAVGGEPFAHYVCHISEVSELADRAVRAEPLVAAMRRIIGEHAWLLDYERFGVVYQDARPGQETYYSRIGWHTDWQSGPHLDTWPSTAFTIHIDGTSPANGVLRVVPGSHKVGPEAQPPGFEPVAGEVAVYAERGDVILHDAHLWHSAARATDDPPLGVRRHIRGGYYGGTPLDRGHGIDDFVKNAAR